MSSDGKGRLRQGTCNECGRVGDEDTFTYSFPSRGVICRSPFGCAVSRLSQGVRVLSRTVSGISVPENLDGDPVVALENAIALTVDDPIVVEISRDDALTIVERATGGEASPLFESGLLSVTPTHAGGLIVFVKGEGKSITPVEARELANAITRWLDEPLATVTGPGAA